MSATQTHIGQEQYRALCDSKGLSNPWNLFAYNVEMLVAAGIATYEDADPFRNISPRRFFLWVPPRPAVPDLAHLMSFIEIDGNEGEDYLGSGQYQDLVQLPDGPYLALNIEDGNGRRNIEAETSKIKISREHRSPYTLFEAIVHGILFPEIFADHGMSICGSEEDSGKAITLSYDPDRHRVRLVASVVDFPSPRRGAPSCGIRLAE
jgi:hypothetical protein